MVWNILRYFRKQKSTPSPPAKSLNEKEHKFPLQTEAELVHDPSLFKASLEKSVICEQCGKTLESRTLKENFYVCPLCNYYFRLPPAQRIAISLDEDSFQELFADITSKNLLGFPHYEEKILDAQQKTGHSEAIIVGTASVKQVPLAVGLMNFEFIGGSMGKTVGERLMNLIFYAISHNLPVLVFSTSGGARMHEGIFSLMQMARTSMALSLLEKAKLPFIVMLTDPTYGGVTASFAMLGDVILAEPGAKIGFAGPRVIEGTIKQTLPQHFQTAEFVQQSGFVDKIVPRSAFRQTLFELLNFYLK